MIKIAIVKAGNIATSTIIDIILDERAHREDIMIRTFGTGSKMQLEYIKEVIDTAIGINPDLLLYVGPNISSKKNIEIANTLKELNVPVVFIGDAKDKLITETLDILNMGYLILEGDPLLGAKRAVLDSTEMVLFNANILKVLAVSGTIHLLQHELDRVISGLKKEEIHLPKIIVNSDLALEYAGIENPYAHAKAKASYEMAILVHKLNYQGCFVLKKKDEYIPCVLSAHELAENAAELAQEARNIEKINDSILRAPHDRLGQILKKVKLYEEFQPSLPEFD
ncbi:MAG: F420-dependent methylenetetrahydromethanopterin dehydrogenase [Promethearchaeota archaeon]